MEKLLPLKFIVVGGSIAGLSAAYTLSKAGHRVVVLEAATEAQLDIPHEGGIRVPPNMARLMREFPGVSSILEEKGTKLTALEFRTETSKIEGAMSFDPQIMSDLGSEFYLVPHYNFCVHARMHCRMESNISFRFGFKVRHVQTFQDGPSVIISSEGEREEGDVIVGADGRNSVVREFMMSQIREDEDDDDDSCSNSTGPGVLALVRDIPGATLSIKISDMMEHEDLKTLTTSTTFTVWMGNGDSITGGRYGCIYVLGLTKSKSLDAVDSDLDWHQSTPSSNFLRGTRTNYNPLVRKLVGLADRAHPTTQVMCHLDGYVDMNERAVLVGDAAHCSPIHATYNSALACEDAYTLGTLFSHLASRSQIPSLLKGYNELRMPRSKACATSEITAMLNNHLPPGDHRVLRNQGLNHTLAIANAPGEHAEDLAALWQGWIALTNYDAKDAVDEWWLYWGRHI
ncbi:FAD/NAD(P)-binding domain-containing protein [Hymenopellis radicata]|nr:FAD/NAD(P)-binding domain-containing protein [Hymenopellis radicata]